MNAVNLGGEGEIPGVLNQQPPWASGPNWISTTEDNPGKTIRELEAEGHQFVLAPNDALPFADGSMDVVYTNSVNIGGRSYLGPYVQPAEVARILKSGGVWIHDGTEYYRKP